MHRRLVYSGTVTLQCLLRPRLVYQVVFFAPESRSRPLQNSRAEQRCDMLVSACRTALRCGSAGAEAQLSKLRIIASRQSRMRCLVVESHCTAHSLHCTVFNRGCVVHTTPDTAFGAESNRSFRPACDQRPRRSDYNF